MASSNPLRLEQGGLARQLLQGQNVRSDLRLLEVDAALLGEILQAGWAAWGPWRCRREGLPQRGCSGAEGGGWLALAHTRTAAA